jgi:hypothetical protein
MRFHRHTSNGWNDDPGPTALLRPPGTVGLQARSDIRRCARVAPAFSQDNRLLRDPDRVHHAAGCEVGRREAVQDDGIVERRQSGGVLGETNGFLSVRGISRFEGRQNPREIRERSAAEFPS